MMLTMLVATIYVCCGIVYVTPGVLPVASLVSVRWSRHVVGFGMLATGIALVETWWHHSEAQPLLLVGLGLVGAGLAAMLVTILRQPCAPKA